MYHNLLIFGQVIGIFSPWGEGGWQYSQSLHAIETGDKHCLMNIGMA